MSWVFHPIPSNHLIQIIDLHKTTRHQNRRNNDTKLIIEYFFSVFPLTWNRNVKNGLIAVMEKKVIGNSPYSVLIACFTPEQSLNLHAHARPFSVLKCRMRFFSSKISTWYISFWNKIAVRPYLVALHKKNVFKSAIKIVRRKQRWRNGIKARDRTWRPENVIALQLRLIFFVRNWYIGWLAVAIGKKKMRIETV